MDKYQGISRAEVNTKQVTYGVVEKKTVPEPKKKGGLSGFTVFRYAVAFILVAIMLCAKFISIAPITKVAGFIRDELSKDSLQQIRRLIDKETDEDE